MTVTVLNDGYRDVWIGPLFFGKPRRKWGSTLDLRWFAGPVEVVDPAARTRKPPLIKLEPSQPTDGYVVRFGEMGKHLAEGRTWIWVSIPGGNWQRQPIPKWVIESVLAQGAQHGAPAQRLDSDA